MATSTANVSLPCAQQTPNGSPRPAPVFCCPATYTSSCFPRLHISNKHTSLSSDCTHTQPASHALGRLQIVGQAPYGSGPAVHLCTCSLGRHSPMPSLHPAWHSSPTTAPSPLFRANYTSPRIDRSFRPAATLLLIASVLNQSFQQLQHASCSPYQAYRYYHANHVRSLSLWPYKRRGK